MPRPLQRLPITGQNSFRPGQDGYARFLHCFASVRSFVDQFTENNIAHCKSQRGQRNGAVTQLSDQIVVATTARNRPQFSLLIKNLKHRSGVISQTTNDSKIEPCEFLKIAMVESGNNRRHRFIFTQWVSCEVNYVFDLQSDCF